MRQGGKTLAPVLPGDDHAEESLVLDELPDLGRQIVKLMGDAPFIQHRAQLLNRTVEKRLLFLRELRLGHREEFFPVGLAAEQIAVPPHCAGIQSFPFGLGNLRQHFPEPVQ